MKVNKQYTLAVDQGIKNTGWAIMDNQGNLIKSGFIVAETETPITRFKEIHEQIVIVFDEYKEHIENITCEALVSTGRGYDTITTNSISGMLHMLALQNNCTFSQFYPSTVKKAAAGHGRATKAKVKNAVVERFNLVKKGMTSHEADAIAIAYTHYIKEIKSGGEKDDSKEN